VARAKNVKNSGIAPIRTLAFPAAWCKSIWLRFGTIYLIFFCGITRRLPFSPYATYMQAGGQKRFQRLGSLFADMVRWMHYPASLGAAKLSRTLIAGAEGAKDGTAWKACRWLPLHCHHNEQHSAIRSLLLERHSPDVSRMQFFLVPLREEGRAEA